MRPALPVNDALRDSEGHPKVFSQSIVAPSFFRMKPAHFQDLFRGELAVIGLLTTAVLPLFSPKSFECFCLWSKPSFFKGILSVVFMGSDEQVIWGATTRTVASVTTQKSVRNRSSVVNLPHVPVNQNVFTVNHYYTVSRFAGCPFPIPASIGIDFDVIKWVHGYNPLSSRWVNSFAMGVPVEASTRFYSPSRRSNQVIEYNNLGFSTITQALNLSDCPSAGRVMRRRISNDFKPSKSPSDNRYFRRHDVCSFKPIKRCASGGRPASTGARCDYCKPSFRVKQHEIALTS